MKLSSFLHFLGTGNSSGTNNGFVFLLFFFHLLLVLPLSCWGHGNDDSAVSSEQGRTKMRFRGTTFCTKLSSLSSFHASPFYNHPHVGLTDSTSSASSSSSSSFQRQTQSDTPFRSWRCKRCCAQLACTNPRLAKRVYRRIQKAALKWEFRTPTTGIIVGPSTMNQTYAKKQPAIAPSSLLWTYVRLLWGTFYVVNPVRVVYNHVDRKEEHTLYTSTAFATCQNHWLKGEERVTVRLYCGSRTVRSQPLVEVEVLSYSRPAFWLVWPFIGPSQNRFFREQLEHLVKIGKEII